MKVSDFCSRLLPKFLAGPTSLEQLQVSVRGSAEQVGAAVDTARHQTLLLRLCLTQKHQWGKADRKGLHPEPGLMLGTLQQKEAAQGAGNGSQEGCSV